MWDSVGRFCESPDVAILNFRATYNVAPTTEMDTLSARALARVGFALEIRARSWAYLLEPNHGVAFVAPLDEAIGVRQPESGDG